MKRGDVFNTLGRPLKIQQLYVVNRKSPPLITSDKISRII